MPWFYFLTPPCYGSVIGNSLTPPSHGSEIGYSMTPPCYGMEARLVITRLHRAMARRRESTEAREVGTVEMDTLAPETANTIKLEIGD